MKRRRGDFYELVRFALLCIHMKEEEIRVVVVWGCIRVEGYLCNAYIYI